MKPSLPSQSLIHVVDPKNTERWMIYDRLQKLDIRCQCSSNQPLQIELNHPVAIAQLVFVVKQLTASRHELIDWLDRCWQVEAKQIQTNSLGTFK